MSDDALWQDTGSIFRPSYSATWLNCLGSLHPSRHAKDTAGIDAAVGTVFHSMMAEWQVNGRPDHWLGRIETIVSEDLLQTFQVEIDEEMFYYGDICLRYYADIPGERFYEIRVDISDLTPIPNQKGTADLAILSRILRIVDWKYGRGVQVFAEENTQELCYAWGIFVKYDPIYHFEEIELHIAQPRLNHFDVWRITRDELIAWAGYIRERAHAAWKRGAPRTVTPKGCQWCKVSATCVALEMARQNLADMTFDAIEEPVTEDQMAVTVASGSPPKQLPEPGELPTYNLSKIVSYQKMFEAFFKRAREELTNRVLDGEELDEWKIVESRSRRRYRNENNAVEKLSLLVPPEELIDHKLKSPAQVEKLLRPAGVRGKLLSDYMKMLTVKPPGKPTLAPDGDNRLAIPDPSDVFDADDEESAL